MKLSSRSFLVSPCLVLVGHLLSVSALQAGTPTFQTGNPAGNGNLYIGYGGTDILQFQPGDKWTNYGYVIEGVSAGDVGVVNLNGAGSTWTINNGAFIGEYGTGTVNITNGGVLTIYASTYVPNIAYGSGSTGIVNVTGPGSILNTSGSFFVGYGGAATLQITQGGVVNSTLTSGSQAVSLAYQSTATAAVTVDGAGSQWNMTNSSLGSYNTANITVSNGGQINTQGFALAGQNSSLTITGVDPTTGAPATFNTTSMVISTSPIPTGSAAAAMVNVTNGGILNSTQTLVGQMGLNVTGAGAVTVDGVNASGAVSQWNVTGLFIVGALGSTGTVTLSNGGTLNVYTSSTTALTGIGDGVMQLGGESSSTYAPGSTGTLNIGNGGAPGVVNAAEIHGYAGPYVPAHSTIIFNHNSSAYYFTRSDGAPILISGSTQLQVLKGTTILSGANTFTGGTTISGGTLDVENNTALGTGAANVTGGTLQIGRGHSVTNGITLSGGSLAQEVATGALLSTLHTYTGAINGGIPTTAQLLDGQTSADANIVGSFAHPSAALNDSDRLSDVFHLSGVATVDQTTGQTDVFVVELKLNVVAPGSYLAWLNPTTNLWSNAVDGNFGGTMNFVSGAYDPLTDFHLGTYGIDVSNGAVWAVVDHDSDFAVLAGTPAPEPSTGLLSGLGLAALASCRRRRRGWSLRRLRHSPEGGESLAREKIQP